MKKFLIAILTAAVFAGCGKDDGPKATGIDGEWALTTLSATKAVTVDGTSLDVYLSFKAGQFEIYQKLGEGSYHAFSGTYSLEGDKLSGKYSDETPLGSEYTVAVADNRLTLTPIGKSEVQTYVSATIPEAVKANAIR